MTTADRIAEILRPHAPEKKLKQPEVPLINQIAALWDARQPKGVPSADPEWIVAARGKIGTREIVGPKHNTWIVESWHRLGATWFNDDETPWCGLFVAWSLNAAGLTYPKEFPRAASFAAYGTACPAQLGAIGVKKRAGGNHVFFIVGITEDRRYYKALGGNQSNMVNIVDIAVGEVTDIRWPAGVPLPARSAIYLPVLPRGTVSTSEA
ncbi:TIGR02594 family protein [Sphingopyxis flava]|uniref:TIGR02594 family protein n=1 Tax=Sphingopyxis flava TaxID=1507287 RepID=A0A1T5ABY6_9SPHN|nr:TIGR02594 family protein [Sphingopyxis flava]SKB32329.1 TIGR02594 family protein [Sphingopyxis flava]